MSEQTCTCKTNYAIACGPRGQSTTIPLSRSWDANNPCPIEAHKPKPPMTDEEVQARLDKIYGVTR